MLPVGLTSTIVTGAKLPSSQTDPNLLTLPCRQSLRPVVTLAPVGATMGPA